MKKALIKINLFLYLFPVFSALYSHNTNAVEKTIITTIKILKNDEKLNKVLEERWMSDFAFVVNTRLGFFQESHVNSSGDEFTSSGTNFAQEFLFGFDGLFGGFEASYSRGNYYDQISNEGDSTFSSSYLGLILSREFGQSFIIDAGYSMMDRYTILNRGVSFYGDDVDAIYQIEKKVIDVEYKGHSYYIGLKYKLFKNILLQFRYEKHSYSKSLAILSENNPQTLNGKEVNLPKNNLADTLRITRLLFSINYRFGVY